MKGVPEALNKIVDVVLAFRPKLKKKKRKKKAHVLQRH